jgi:hypothetical protein
MESRTQTGPGGGVMTLAGATLALDQFAAIIKKAQETLDQNPKTCVNIVGLVHSQIYWCFKQAEFTVTAPSTGLAEGAVKYLFEIPVPTAAQKQRAESLERQYA